MKIDVTGIDGVFSVYYNGVMHCSRNWRFSLLMARLKYLRKYILKILERFMITDKNGVKISKGCKVNYNNDTYKVLFARGKKIILISRDAITVNAIVTSLRDRITNIEVIQ